MDPEQLHAVPAEGVHATVWPDVRTRAAVLAKLEVVLVRGLAVLEHEHQLVRRAIERAHAGVRLCPNAEVLKLKAIALAGFEELAHMAPIHAYEQDGAVMQRRDQRGDELGEEGREVVLGHLARRHRELAVPRIAEAGDESVDLHVVRWVGENDARLAPACQTTDQVGVASVAAGDRVTAKNINVPALNPRRGDGL